MYSYVKSCVMSVRTVVPSAPSFICFERLKKQNKRNSTKIPEVYPMMENIPIMLH